MKGEILTNMIDVNVDFDALRSRYVFFIITNRGERPWRALMDAADAFVGNENILSVRYQRFGDDSNIYIMAKVGTDRRIVLKHELDMIDDEFIIEKKDPKELWSSSPWILVQLLLNALGGMSLFGNQFGNMTGRYLCVHQDWLKFKKSKGKPSGFKALEFKVQPAVGDRMVLDMSVVSFTRVDLFGDNPKVKRMARYNLEGLRPMRTGADAEDAYVIKTIGNKKNTIDYFDLYEDKFRHCKVGILCSLLKRFNTFYTGVVSIGLVPMKESERIRPSSYACFTNGLKDIVARKVEETDITVMDLVHDSESIRCVEDVREAIKLTFDKDIVVSDFSLENSFTICIIHDKDYYEDSPERDPHRMYEGSWVQHITIEETKDRGISDVIINVLAKELVIKDDLSKGVISLFDWRALELDHDLEFIRGVHSGDDNEYLTICILTVHPDGTIEFKAMDSMECMDEVSFLWESETRSSDPEYVMRDGIGNVCVVRKAPFLPVPDERVLRMSYGKTGSDGPKGNVVKTDGINSLIDLSISKLDGTTYYISGYYRYARYETNQKAPRIRSMETTPGGEYLESLALQLMNVPFVRYNQLTVAPFPVKYLNEAIRSKGIAIERDTDVSDC